MGKKSKVPSIPKPESVSGSDSSTVFSKLFGHAPDPDPESDALTSIFSADNPFRRKHVDAFLQAANESASELADRNAKESAVESPNLNPNEKKKKKEKKKKRVEEVIEGVDEERSSEDAVRGKKSKQEGEKKESELDVETNPNDEKKKRKRKRDELEKEYEEKKYGAAPGDEDSKEKLAGRKRKTAENPAEMTVSKEGYDDESKLLRTIFVGNLPVKIKKKVLLKEFCEFGEVESVRLRSIPTLDGKKPKKVMIRNKKINEAADSIHAYIVFNTEQSAEASLAHNMAVVEGNHIRVDRACPPRKKLKGDSTPLYDTKRTIFVGNLPFDVKDEELYQLFTGLNQVGSSIEAVRVIRDSDTSLGKGIAYVLLKTREAANLLAKRRNLKLRNRELRLSHAKPDSNSTSAKRKTPPGDKSENPSGKKLALEPKTPNSGNKPRMSASASYEGVRATKSGNKETKPYRKVTQQPVVFRSGSKGKDEVKQRAHKRPAVAARRAKTDALKASGNGSNQAGKKRKFGSRTPQSSYKKSKKAKTFK